jgi:transcription elongation factor Elf1
MVFECGNCGKELVQLYTNDDYSSYPNTFVCSDCFKKLQEQVSSLVSVLIEKQKEAKGMV